MTDQEIIQEIEKSVKNSDSWSVYHHLKDNLGYPALMLRETNTSVDTLGVNLNVFKGNVYLFLDNGTPAEPGKPLSIQNLDSLKAMEELLEIVKPYLKKN